MSPLGLIISNDAAESSASATSYLTGVGAQAWVGMPQ